MEAARKQHSEHIIESFGSWAPDTKMCHGCWTEDRAQTTTGHHHVVIEGACECDGHKWDNQTNWDMGRRKFCDGLNAELEKEHPFPEELKYVNFGHEGWPLLKHLSAPPPLGLAQPGARTHTRRAMCST